MFNSLLSRLLIFVLALTIFSACQSVKNRVNYDSSSLAELVKYHKIDTLHLSKDITYTIENTIELPGNLVMEGNGATIRVLARENRIHAAFLINGNNISINNINLVSESKYTMIGHRDKVKVNPLTSNIYAFVSHDAYSNFKLTNSTFRSLSSVLKLSNMDELLSIAKQGRMELAQLFDQDKRNPMAS